MKLILIFILVVGVCSFGAIPESVQTEKKRLQALSKFLKGEKGAYNKREKKQRSLGQDLDRINLSQNHIRNELEALSREKEELAMVLDNLSLERDIEARKMQQQKKALRTMLHLLYRVHRDGFVEFILGEKNLIKAIGKTRLVFRSLTRSAESIKEVKEREKRLAKTQTRLVDTKKHLDALVERSQTQGRVLSKLIVKKQRVLRSIKKKQRAYRTAQVQHRRLSKRVASIIAEIERNSKDKAIINTNGRNLFLPVEFGKLAHRYGRSKSTKRFHKGIEIEAAHSSPVYAVENGVVEFEGWIQGLGNVIIVRHGKGLYSLSGHMHQVAADKGDQVRKGEIIGFVGDTGRSAKPGLYFELRLRDKVINPRRYFAKTTWKRLL